MIQLVGAGLQQQVDIKKGILGPLIVDSSRTQRFTLFLQTSTQKAFTEVKLQATKMRFAWVPEISGIVASASLLVALSVILATYDGQAVFDWKGVTLNAVVSVISTASKASLLYSISQLISQWKWIIFARTRRPLMDFERVDSASRGPMGSLELMWKCNSMYVAATDLVIQNTTTFC